MRWDSKILETIAMILCRLLGPSYPEIINALMPFPSVELLAVIKAVILDKRHSIWTIS